LSYKKCAVKPWNCPDKEKQEEMIKKIETMNKECKKWEAELYFEDAVHQLHTTVSGYAIQRKWREWTKVLSSNTGRDRYTVLGAINAHTWRFLSQTTRWTCNKELMKWLLETISKDRKSELEKWKKIYLVLDNARYQKAYEVQDYAKELWIILVYLPPYCPHLNIIERLWKRLKWKLANKYYPTFDWFCIAIEDILLNIELSYEELQWLLNLKFRII
jgi:transposase